MNPSSSSGFLSTSSSSSSMTGFRPSTSYSVTKAAPFAMDYDVEADWSDNYKEPQPRKGGPKEARLFRVSMLRSDRETDHLFPIRVIFRKGMTEYNLKEAFSRFGQVENVYIPRNLQTGLPAGYAMVRFTTKEAQERALIECQMEDKAPVMDGKKVEVGQLEKQKSFFGGNTGSLGICNEPSGDFNLRFKEKVPVQQDIDLKSCLSRSGYPWSSNRELVVLEPHAPKETNYMLHSIKLSNLNRRTTQEQVTEYFERYGPVEAVYFPKPLQVILRNKDANQGYGYVRFSDVRDLRKALWDINQGKVAIDGNTLQGKYTAPQVWPTEKTRRYY